MTRSSFRTRFLFDRTLGFVLLLFVTSVALRAQSDTLEHTLLWRIDGNGLTKSSYLYGTFHVTDPRAFNFRDSVLPALQSCDIAAFELHTDSMSTQVLQKLFSPDSVTDLRDYLSPDEFAMLDLRLREATGVPGEAHRYTDPSFLLVILDQPSELSMEEFDEKDLEEELDDESSSGEGFWSRIPKETFLDAWLFRTAQFEGKRVVGLETIDEQIATTDTIPIGERARMLVETITVDPLESAAMWRTLVDAYQREDLNTMITLVNEEYTTPGLLFKLLTERNRRMVERMELLMREGSLFTAVGAAHLPGDEGLIALLRARGYSVTPVLSERTGVASRYKRPDRELPWYSLIDEEKGFTLEIPIRPAEYPEWFRRIDNAPYQLDGHREPKVRWRLITDITTNLSYYIIEEEILLEDLLNEDPLEAAGQKWFESSAGEESLSSLLGMRSAMMMRSKEIVVDGVTGKEFTGVDTDGELTRIRVFQRGGERYTFMVSGGTSLIKSREDSRFLKSIRFTPKAPAQWEPYGLFGLFDGPMNALLPNAPTYDTIEMWSSAGQSFDATITATSVDPGTGIYYVLAKRQLSPRITALNDSLLVREMAQSGIPVDSVVRETITELASEPRVRRISEHRFEFASGATLTRRVILEESRAWSIGVARPPDVSAPEDEARFFNSREFVGVEITGEPTEYRDLNFSIGIHSPITDSSESYFLKAREFGSGMWRGNRSYQAIAVTYSPYFEPKDEEDLFKQLLQTIAYNEDTIIDERRVTDRGLEWREYTVAVLTGDTPGRKYRLRAALHGARMYKLRWFSLDPNDDPKEADEFFSTFTLLDPAPQGDLFSRKIDLLLNDISSADSATRERANDALISYPFRQEDIPKLYDALKRDYPEPADIYSQPTRARLVDAFKTVHDDRSVKVLRDLYRKSQPDDRARSNVLDALASIRTDESLETFRELIVEDPPADAYSYAIFSAFYQKLDGIEKLYPEILALVENSSMRSTIVEVTNMALDSGRITLDDTRAEDERVSRLCISLLEQYRETANDPESYSYDPIYPWDAEGMIALLGKLPGNKEVDNLLKRTLRDENLNVKRASAVALLRHGEEVRAKWLVEIADDHVERMNLYRNLETAKLLHHFPAEYLSQILFVESLISEQLYWQDEYVPEEIEYVADREIEWNGEKLRGYLIKYRYANYGEEEKWGPWQVALCAQPLDPNQVSANTNYVRINWTDFDPERIDEQFAELMAQEVER